MQRFFIFLLTLALLVYGTDFVLTSVFDAMYQRTWLGQSGGEINQYLALKPAPLVLLMGNSRARYQVNPDSFAIAMHSLCHAGMDQCFQTGLLQVLELEHKLPEVVLLHVDLSEYAQKESLEDMGTLRYYYNKIPIVTEDINQISRYERVKYLFRFYRYNGRIVSQLKNFVQSRNGVPVSNGYQPLEPFPFDTTTMTANRDTTPVSRHHFQYTNLGHLLKFVDICQRNHVKLLCFTSPYFNPPSYSAVVAPVIDSVLQSHGIPYLNCLARALPVLKHHAHAWHDNDHLNRIGAGYFSHQVAQWSKPYVLVTDTLRKRAH